MKVSRVSLAPKGLQVSRLIYGTWRLKDDPRGFSPERIVAKIEACLEVGITTFDLADIYGGYECETIFGAALRSRPDLRDKIEIITKCGIVAAGTNHPTVQTTHYNASGNYIISSVDRALKVLGIDRIDLLLVHRPDWLARADDTGLGLDTVVRQGKAGAVGVSNYSVSEMNLLRSVMDSPLVTNQVEVSLFHMDALYDGVLARCEELNIRPMAWSPTAGGRLFQEKDETARRIRETAARLSHRYGNATVDQLALAWILTLPSRPTVVLGTNQPERIRSAAAADTVILEREDWYAFWEAARGRSVP